MCSANLIWENRRDDMFVRIICRMQSVSNVRNYRSILRQIWWILWRIATVAILRQMFQTSSFISSMAIKFHDLQVLQPHSDSRHVGPAANKSSQKLRGVDNTFLWFGYRVKPQRDVRFNQSSFVLYGYAHIY